MQLLVAAIAMVVYICLQFFHRPFMEDELDAIDCASLLSVLFYILAGLVFLVGTDSQDEMAVVVALFLATLATLCISIRFFLYQFKRLKAQERSGKAFITQTSCVWLATVLHISHHFRSLEALRAAIHKIREPDGTILYEALSSFLNEHMHTIQNIRDKGAEGITIDLLHSFIFLVLDADRGGKLTCEEVLAGLYISGVDQQTWEEWRKYIRDISGIQVQAVDNAASVGKVEWRPIKSFQRRAMEAKSLHRIVSAVKSQVSLRQLQLRLKRYQLVLERNGGQIHGLFSPARLKAWLDRETHCSREGELMAAALVDQLITPYTNDSSLNGPFSYHKKAKFYRDLVKANPMFLEYVIEASDEQIHAFNTFITGLQKMQEMKEASGTTVTQEIQAERRSPLLDWLINQSTSIQRRVFREFIGLVSNLHDADAHTAFTQQLRVHPHTVLCNQDAALTWASPRVSKSESSSGPRDRSDEGNIPSDMQSTVLSDDLQVYQDNVKGEQSP